MATENWEMHGIRCFVARSWNFSSPPSSFSSY